MINMERLESLKHEVFQVTPELCSERARLITESYKATKGMPPVLRRAKALEHILAERTIFVRPGELFVGAISAVSRGYEWYPEYTLDIEPELDDVPKRTIDRYIVREETKRELVEAFAYWRTYETVQKELCGARLRAVLPEEVFAKGILLDKRGGAGEGHLVPNFHRLMQGSLADVIVEAERRKEALVRTVGVHPENAEKCLFLEAIVIVCRAAIQYARRYAQLLAEHAAAERDPGRRSELEQMCRAEAERLGLDLDFRQSDHEGEIVGWLHEAQDAGFAGVILNAAGYTHTSVAIRDAVAALTLPVLELHLTNPDAREAFRRTNLLADVVTAGIRGLGVQGYLLALQGMQGLLAGH